MNEGQWMLEYPGVALTLGSDPALGAFYQRGFHHVTAPKLNEVVMITDDSDNPRDDGVSFGEDTYGGQDVVFDLGIMGSSNNDVVELANELMWKWRADVVRKNAGALATLRAQVAGRERLMYGRPRRMDPPTHTKPRSRFMSASCTFALVINQFYGPEQSVSVGFVPPPSGGFAAPFTTPITTVSVSEEESALVIGGDLPASPVVTIQGPITTPYVRVNGLWELALDMSILADQSVTIDCRPWEQTVYRQDGASYAGALMRGRDRLDKAQVPPGTWPIALGGIDPTGTSTATVSWRNTYSYI